VNLEEIDFTCRMMVGRIVEWSDVGVTTINGGIDMVDLDSLVVAVVGHSTVVVVEHHIVVVVEHHIVVVAGSQEQEEVGSPVEVTVGVAVAVVVAKPHKLERGLVLQVLRSCCFLQSLTRFL